MRDLQDLKSFWRRHTAEPLVLCTLVRKRGSSYRGLGAKKLISASESCGLLSGGCLEASIEKMAREDRGFPFIATFNAEADEDRLLGYQLGCQGEIDVLFERIPAGLPESEIQAFIPYGFPKPFWGVRLFLEEFRLGRREILRQHPSTSVGEALDERWEEPIRLVVVGCGPDADSFYQLGSSLGWDLTFLDHRREFARQERFPGAATAHADPASMLAGIPSGLKTAVVLMSHNYEVDLEVLRTLVTKQVGYVGCLGPRERYERLKKDLVSFHGMTVPVELESKVFAPPGRSRKSRSPSEIALSIIGQIQEVLIDVPNLRPWTVILAAGKSERFGRPKALAQWRSQSLIERAIHTAQEFSEERVVVVTGADSEALRPSLGGVVSVINQRWEEGMGGSIAAGLRAVLDRNPRAEQFAILPVDQPLVDAQHLRRLTVSAFESDRCALTVSGAVMGPPAVVPRRFFDLVLGLETRCGLKSVLRPDEFVGVRCDTALTDVDTPVDLKKLESMPEETTV